MFVVSTLTSGEGGDGHHRERRNSQDMREQLRMDRQGSMVGLYKLMNPLCPRALESARFQPLNRLK